MFSSAPRGNRTLGGSIKKFVFNDISCQLRFIAIQYIITPPSRFIGAITI